MKRIELKNLETLIGGQDTPCTVTVEGLAAFAGAAASSLTPMGLALGIVVGGVAVAGRIWGCPGQW